MTMRLVLLPPSPQASDPRPLHPDPGAPQTRWRPVSPMASLPDWLQFSPGSSVQFSVLVVSGASLGGGELVTGQGASCRAGGGGKGSRVCGGRGPALLSLFSCSAFVTAPHAWLLPFEPQTHPPAAGPRGRTWCPRLRAPLCQRSASLPWGVGGLRAITGERENTFSRSRLYQKCLRSFLSRVAV